MITAFWTIAVDVSFSKLCFTQRVLAQIVVIVLLKGQLLDVRAQLGSGRPVGDGLDRKEDS